jgi:hypothetical protein
LVFATIGALFTGLPVALALLGGIIGRADAGSLKLSQPQWPALELEFEVDGHGYWFTDNFPSGEIEMQQTLAAGPALHSFSNDTPVDYVQAAFRGLR